MTDDPRIAAVPDIHGHAKGEHKLYVDERPIPYTARMLFLWFFHACRRGSPRFLMVADHINYLTFEDPAAVNLVRRALKLAQAGDLYGAAETAGVEVAHAGVVGDGLRRGMRYSIGAEVDNDPRSRPDAQNIVDAMRPDGIVRSVHFLPITHPQFGENWMWPFDNPEFRDLYDVVGTEQTWELYIATLLDAIEKLPGHIVGHFYVPGKFGHWPADEVLESYEDRLLDACAERGMAVEINARTFYKYAVGDEAQLEKYRAVNLRLLRKAKEKGVAVAVGSDAHSPKDQGRGFSEILALLDEADINEIAFPIDGRMARVALRATDELRQASARSGGAKDQTEIAIPGTEEPEPIPESVPESLPVAAGMNGSTASPAVAPKKRPSRAKKPAVPTEAASPEAPETVSTPQAPSEPLDVPPDAAAESTAASADPVAETVIPSEKAASDPAFAALNPASDQLQEASTELPPESETEPEPAPAIEAAPTAALAAAAAPAEASSEEAPEEAPESADDSEEPAPVTAALAAASAVTAVASAAVAAVVSAIKRRGPAPSSREPAEPARSEPPKRARPAKAGPASKPAVKSKSQGAKSPVAAKTATAPKTIAASKPAVAAKPAEPKRGAKAAAKPPARGATAKVLPSAAKAKSPVAPRKRVVVKAAAKKATPARATAATAKKSAAKKPALVRKPVAKGVSKTASRASVKKTSAKKTVKKKTKQRR